MEFIDYILLIIILCLSIYLIQSNKKQIKQIPKQIQNEPETSVTIGRHLLLDKNLEKQLHDIIEPKLPKNVTILRYENIQIGDKWMKVDIHCTTERMSWNPIQKMKRVELRQNITGGWVIQEIRDFHQKDTGKMLFEMSDKYDPDSFYQPRM